MSKTEEQQTAFVFYKCPQIRKGHQGKNPGGHSFVFLNVSINNKPVFVSEVVTFKKLAQSDSTPAYLSMQLIP
jgi:hypothetical protein